MGIINIGVDIVEIFRIKNIIKNNPRFVNRVFTAREIQASKKKTLVYGEYAIRFAAKESTMKALGTGWRKGIRWQDIELLHKNSGQPYIILRNKAKELAAKLGVAKILVSLSHSQKYAVANVVLCGK